eukprot:1202730-Amorphochlora_amoeboformis.AAC.1
MGTITHKRQQSEDSATLMKPKRRRVTLALEVEGKASLHELARMLAMLHSLTKTKTKSDVDLRIRYAYIYTLAALSKATSTDWKSRDGESDGLSPLEEPGNDWGKGLVTPNGHCHV